MYWQELLSSWTHTYNKIARAHFRGILKLPLASVRVNGYARSNHAQIEGFSLSPERFHVSTANTLRCSALCDPNVREDQQVKSYPILTLRVDLGLWSEIVVEATTQ